MCIFLSKICKKMYTFYTYLYTLCNCDSHMFTEFYIVENDKFAHCKTQKYFAKFQKNKKCISLWKSQICACFYVLHTCFFCAFFAFFLTIFCNFLQKFAKNVQNLDPHFDPPKFVVPINYWGFCPRRDLRRSEGPKNSQKIAKIAKNYSTSQLGFRKKVPWKKIEKIGFASL